MEKPKIAIITIKNNYSFGGVLSYLREVYKFLGKYFDPTVFYLSFDSKISANLKTFNFKNDIRETDYLGMRVIEIGSKWAFWEPGHYKYSLNLWQKVLQDYDYFILVSGSNIAAYPLVKLNKKFLAIVSAAYQDDRAQRADQLPMIRKFIDFFSQFKMKKIEKEIFQKSSYLLPISKDTKKRINQIIGHNRDNLAICGFPMGVKVNGKFLSENKNIIAVGRFSDPRKNFDMLMQAFNNIYEKDNSIKLYIVGSKPEQKQIIKFSNQSFYKNIIFTGNLNENELSQFYEIADLILITSYQEGLGLIGLEAMSYGIPVVATNCGGPKDFVIDGKNGFLVNINDYKNMAEKALYILSSNDIYKDFSKYASSFVKDNYSKNKFESILINGFITVYPELKDLFEYEIEKNDIIFNDNIKKEENISI